MPEPVRVFVSHHHSPEEDTFTARLVADLRAAGADVWVDTSGITSDDFVKKISEGLSGRQWLVLVMTPAALASSWVQREVNAALNEHTAGRMLGVLPLVAQPCREQDIPVLWRTLHRYDATRDYPSALAGLLAVLGLSTSTPVKPASPPLHVSALPPLGPALAPAGATPALHLTPMPLYNLGFRGYAVGGVECVLPPICPVPGGIFTMGSDKTRDRAADDDETPPYPVQVSDFALGQYPVTVAEYACAVQAKATHEPPEDTFAKTTWAQQLERPDHPVVCVSWRDALAYTRWLAKLTGQGWRLPTEAEWEKAARWDTTHNHGRIYPWGDEWDKTRANTDDSGPGTTSPVGAYAERGDASPYGAHDLAGNVWEWTSTLKQPYPYSHDSKHEAPNFTGNRVLRGGAWVYGPRDCRTAYRVGGYPANSSDNRGFRVLFASAGS